METPQNKSQSSEKLCKHKLSVIISFISKILSSVSYEFKISFRHLVLLEIFFFFQKIFKTVAQKFTQQSNLDAKFLSSGPSGGFLLLVFFFTFKFFFVLCFILPLLCLTFFLENLCSAEKRFKRYPRFLHLYVVLGACREYLCESCETTIKSFPLTTVEWGMDLYFPRQFEESIKNKSEEY